MKRFLKEIQSCVKKRLTNQEVFISIRLGLNEMEYLRAIENKMP